jgi:two-component system alkaline phosphatase synthesis response regulator PhoP
MVVAPDPQPPRDGRAAAGRASPRRVDWLVLARDGAAAELAERVDTANVRVTSDPRRFRDLLIAERPRIVVCAQPPADRAALDAVAAERRRRTTMRAVHVAPPHAVAERLAALDLGFDDALAATTTLAELAGRLAWLDGKARPRQPTARLPVGDGLELDTAARELRRGDLLVHLRPKEFGLLALLASHPGRAYSRRELLDRVWGPGHEGGSRTVDVHVRWLRAKLELDPEHPVHLVTVRGVGYRLDLAT